MKAKGLDTTNLYFRILEYGINNNGILDFVDITNNLKNDNILKRNGDEGFFTSMLLKILNDMISKNLVEIITNLEHEALVYAKRLQNDNVSNYEDLYVKIKLTIDGVYYYNTESDRIINRRFHNYSIKALYVMGLIAFASLGVSVASLTNTNKLKYCPCQSTIECSKKCNNTYHCCGNKKEIIVNPQKKENPTHSSVESVSPAKK